MVTVYDESSGANPQLKAPMKLLPIFDTADLVGIDRPALVAPVLVGDMPPLISDHDLTDDETASMMSLRTSERRGHRQRTQTAVSPFTPMSPGEPRLPLMLDTLLVASVRSSRHYRHTSVGSPRASPRTTFTQLNTQIHPPALGLLFGPPTDNSPLLGEQLKFQRQKLMAVLVKYIATKIYNSFPPESPKIGATSELGLDKFLLILVSRLRLTLPVFMKGVIYLFRYMDIIYLLRYLNQLNNFANYCAMDFELKPLIVGCIKLAVSRERELIKLKLQKLDRPIADPYQHIDWSRVGMSHADINNTVKTIVTRMNGKLMIKNVELVKLRSEMLRFVKMVAKVQG